jgi:2-haloacid dehalogenase
LVIDAVVFDLGGVLLDWNPRHLYRKLFDDEAAMEQFLRDVCTPQWHAPHDRGQPTAASCAELATRFPDQADLIWAWSERSEEMVNGALEGTVAILRDLKDAGMRCYALTNMEAETYPLRRDRFPFFALFDGTVVSAQEELMKPEPEIFLRLLERFELTAASTLFIDDAPENVEAARQLGLQVILFRSAQDLRMRLEALGVLPLTRAFSSDERARQ